MKNDIAVFGLILAGGSGVRLWPRSREELPKQFLVLQKGNSLLQDTVERMLNLLPPERLHVVSGAKWKALVNYQASEVASVAPDFLIEEPAARNTAPAILLGCEWLKRKGASEKDVVIVAPSDHVVQNMAAFKDTLEKAVDAAAAGFMTTLGILPSRPETGFGYIHCPRSSDSSGGPERWREVRAFVEKPDSGQALEYMKRREYFWNGGIFVFSLETFYRELEQSAPDLYEAAQEGCDALARKFPSLPSISFDYAVMEKAKRVAMVELDAGWSDVGSWDALYEILEKDERNNAAVGDVVAQESESCLVDSRGRLTALVDVKDLIVVDSPDALFITRRGSSQKVRDVAGRLKAEGRKEFFRAPESVRPWGTYRILCEEERFKIKRIVITPGKRLSLQYHHHRSEHWIVVRGTAFVTLNGETRFVHEGESIFISKGASHRLENPGRIDLEIVEIQGGEYLGEDDIVRLDDDFSRA